MSVVSERQQKIVDEFEKIPSWEDRYKKIIAIGKSMGEPKKFIQQDDNLVKGCTSKVWLTASLNSKGQVIFEADSDAMIVKGLVALLVDVYSGATPDEILATQPSFMTQIGLASHLSPSRANGLNAMVKQIQIYALAFKTKLSMN